MPEGDMKPQNETWTIKDAIGILFPQTKFKRDFGP